MKCGFYPIVVFLLANSIAHAGDRPPNTILVMSDDQGWGDVGFNGNQRIKTPHLDAMAAAGIRFNRFYAAAPLCSPTRGSCLAGRYPFRFGLSLPIWPLVDSERGFAVSMRSVVG